MAFDRPIEADRVDDLGLLASLIRAPVVGIMWLLGGDHAGEADEEEQQNNKRERVEQELLTSAKEDSGGCRSDDESADADDHASNRCHDRGQAGNDPVVPPPAPKQVKEANDGSGHDKSNKENELSSLPNWPSVGFLDASDSDEDAPICKKSKQERVVKSSNARSRSPRQSSRRDEQSSDIDPAAEMIGDLVAVMESSHISDQKDGDGSPGPATSAVLTSQSNVSSSSTDSLSASYSASTFPNHQTSQLLPPPSNLNIDSTHLSKTSTQGNSNSSIRGNKKMSWSDECGDRSLVEYFDDSAAAPQSKHWSAMKRNGSRSSRRNSFDVVERGMGTRHSEVRVIKSALKRSGSYSPPVALYGNDCQRLTASTSRSTESSSTASSSPGMKSFRSISIIGSSDSSTSNSSGHLSKADQSADSNDSMAALTETKLNTNDVQCVPSTLQVGCGRASGGLIIPRGGPSDPRYYFPNGGVNDQRYQLILGAGVPVALGHQVDTSEGEQGERSVQNVAKAKVRSSPNPATAISGGRGSPGHHHFLPRHTNGYISPQYGFYVNITPPTPELYAKVGDKSSKNAVLQQQSYQQFQYQSQYRAPSPIPEGAPDKTQGIPQRYVGRSTVPRPSSNRSSEGRGQLLASRQIPLKPTFTKNKKGNPVSSWADNPHHGVWPTVPFG
mmetsp:Transcript_3464/g.8794  ORF Transcript_3464/g.8794 Transcript_3464/m.8794 type:complete len:670 (+) Transcript_3464:137-2146(+)